MLEHYFIRPDTVDRIRASWLGDRIETYVTWMAEHAYKACCVDRRVPLLVAFGEFARQRGADRVELLAGEIGAFVRSRFRHRARPCRSKGARQQYIRDIRKPIEQFLRVVQFGEPTRRSGLSRPFVQWAPGFFGHLRDERGAQRGDCRRVCVSARAVRAVRRGASRRGSGRPVARPVRRVPRGA